MDREQALAIIERAFSPNTTDEERLEAAHWGVVNGHWTIADYCLDAMAERPPQD